MTRHELDEAKVRLGHLKAAGILAEVNITKERAYELRAAIETAMEYFDDETAAGYPELMNQWKTDVPMATGSRVTYDGVVYKVLQDHTSQSDWTPDISSSLFAKVLIPDDGTIPEWKQPDSTNGYMTGDKVTHNGKTWVSGVDSNVWEPGVSGTETLWIEE